MSRRQLVSLADVLVPRRILQSTLAVTHFDVRLPDLPEALDRFTIAHISDLHVGPRSWEPVHAREAADLVHNARVDVVANSGDYMQWEPPIEKVASFIRPFVNREDRPPHVAILGNHDYYAGAETIDRLTDCLTSLGVHVLVNETICVERCGSRVSFAGLTLEVPGFERAAAELAISDGPRIALIHEPDVAEHLPPASADLALAGHTHGGQITLPGLERVATRYGCGSSYVEGLYRINDVPVYVNRGLGCTGLPIRFRARPQLTFLRLRR